MLHQLLAVSFAALATSAPVVRPGAPLRSLSKANKSLWNRCSRGRQPARSQLPVWSGRLEEFFNDYRQLKDINRFVDILQIEYPELLKVHAIGNSWHGRPLRMLELTNRSSGVSAADKPSIVMIGGIHAREWIATATVLFIVQTLLQQANTTAGVASLLLQDYVVSVAAPANPDGYVYSWEVDRMWRKTRSDRETSRCGMVADGVGGVDANRNWGYTWGMTEDVKYKKQMANPCTEVYIGPSAFSEPETKALADYMGRRQQHSFASRSAAGVAGPGYVAAFLDYHSFAQVLLPPWAYTAETPSAPDGDYQTGLTSAMVDAFSATSGRRFKAGADVFPPDPGTGPDWAYGYLGVRATMTVELEGSIENEDGGFCLSAAFITQVGKEQFAGFIALTQYLLAKGDAPSSQVGLFVRSGASEFLVKSEANQLTLGPLPVNMGFATLASSLVLLVSLSGLFLLRRIKSSSRDVAFTEVPSTPTAHPARIGSPVF